MVTVGLGAGVAGGGAVIEIGLGAMLATLIEDGEVVAGAESLAGGLVTAGLPQAVTRKTTATRIAISSRKARPRLRRFFTEPFWPQEASGAQGADPFIAASSGRP